MIGKINFWQCRKWQGRFSEVAEEAKNADFSAFSIGLQIARLAILDEADEFFTKVRIAVASGDLRMPDLLEWPLFRDIRKDVRFKPLIEELQKREEPAVATALLLQQGESVDVN